MKEINVFPKKLGIIPYVFLIYLLMPFYYLLNETGMKAVIGYSLLLLFLIVYRQLYQDVSDTLYFLLVGIQFSIILLLTILYNPFNILLGFYTSSFIGWFSNKRNFYIATILYASCLLAISIWIAVTISSKELMFFLPYLVVMLISPFGMRSMNERTKLEERLDEANEKIRTLSKQEERVRIARDLHDTLGHTLSLITFQSQLVQKMINKNPEKALQEAKGIEQTSRAALQQVRELVAEMRIVTIEEELLHIEKLLQKASIQFSSAVTEPLPRLSPLQQSIIGMSLREAVTNVVKHSKATTCHIVMQSTSSCVTIKVEDNGVGFEKMKAQGNGLKGMKERLSLIEGTMSFVSEQGAKLQLSIPILANTKEGSYSK